MSSNPMTNPQQPIDALAGKLKRTELQHSPSSIPGREIVQVLTEIPAGVESGWHMHPGEEVGYILAGTVVLTPMYNCARIKLTAPRDGCKLRGMSVIIPAGGSHDQEQGSEYHTRI